MNFDFRKIYVQRSIYDDFIWRANAESITSRFPQAEIIEVESHWQIPDLFEADAKDWMKTKRERLVLGIKSGLTHTKNGRSADFIATSNSNGCLSSCQYCYVARRKGASNPLTIFVNIEEIAGSIRRHQQKLGKKPAPNQCDDFFWTYDIGCNADLSADSYVCDNPAFLIKEFATMDFAKATFATKTVRDDYWLKLDPKGKTRIRYSLMPQEIARYVDIGTSPISERIESTNKLVEAGYEVHFSFAPIIVYDDWKIHWKKLWNEIDEVLTDRAKSQLKCEAFFLTHSADLHETNLQWNARGEDFLWNPALQVPKKTAPDTLVYDYEFRRREIAEFEKRLNVALPYCPVRYSF
ncbi:MAG: spore photoproduct lyase family protein [Pyrinomonadaceae bacterium]|nr:spore photoproduct lyase family protein [Pyrinomonadaceae bacterium]